MNMWSASVDGALDINRRDLAKPAIIQCFFKSG